VEESLGGYVLRGELGRGAMGIVWRAYDPKLDREVAIKEAVIPATADERMRKELGERFVREGRAAARLNHPGIVTIHAADVYDGRPAIVMELIDGTTLTDRIRGHRMYADQVAEVLGHLVDAIGYAHRCGIVHRDIKPDNVFVTHDRRVKLADFGIARLAEEATLTQAGTVMGTPGYMSPEQVVGQVADARSDLFSIGVIAYEMLAGRNPFGSSEGMEPTAVMYKIVHEHAQPLTPSEVPPYLAAIIGKAMSKDPALRYQAAEEMLADLRSQRVPEPGTQDMALQPTQVMMAGASEALVSTPPAETVISSAERSDFWEADELPRVQDHAVSSGLISVGETAGLPLRIGLLVMWFGILIPVWLLVSYLLLMAESAVPMPKEIPLALSLLLISPVWGATAYLLVRFARRRGAPRVAWIAIAMAVALFMWPPMASASRPPRRASAGRPSRRGRWCKEDCTSPGPPRGRSACRPSSRSYALARQRGPESRTRSERESRPSSLVTNVG
jgi:serine/threonine protein kinase